MASEQTSPCPECGETPDSPTFYRHRVCKQSAAWVDPLTASEMSTRQTTSAVGEPDAATDDLRKALWRALGEASVNHKGDDPYIDRLLERLRLNGLEVRFVSKP